MRDRQTFLFLSFLSSCMQNPTLWQWWQITVEITARLREGFHSVSRRFSGFAGVTGGCVERRRNCAQVRGLHLHGDARAHTCRGRERQKERKRDLNKRKCNRTFDATKSPRIFTKFCRKIFWYLQLYSQVHTPFTSSVNPKKFRGRLELVCSILRVVLLDQCQSQRMLTGRQINAEQRNPSIISTNWEPLSHVKGYAFRRGTYIFCINRRPGIVAWTESAPRAGVRFNLLSSACSGAVLCTLWGVASVLFPFLTVCVDWGNFLLACPVWCVQGQWSVLTTRVRVCTFKLHLLGTMRASSS